MDDDVDLDILQLLRQRFGLVTLDPSAPPDTRVLRDAEYVYNNSIDVAISMVGTQAVAALVYEATKNRSIPDTEGWGHNGLHPITKDVEALKFIFTIDLLNFSFWSEKGGDEKFSIAYDGKKWTGYWSLVAALRRALEEGIEITNPEFWHGQDFTLDVLKQVFRSETEEAIPLLEERYNILKESAEVLCKEFEMDVTNIIEQSHKSAAGLVNLLAEKFPAFRDQTTFEGKPVRFLKRAQIFAADVWAAFEGQGHGEFHDIDHLTMFPDYRVSQQLREFGALEYSPMLDKHIKEGKDIPAGHAWEVQIRGCSIWCIELVRRAILRLCPQSKLNAVTIDFFLYDLGKELEESNSLITTHHRTRSIWY